MNCPICGKASEMPIRPFCSKRCADVDLSRWLNGSYAVPSNDPEDFDALDEALSKAQAETAKDRTH